MSALNANASEWKPTENAMSSFLLPETTSAMANEPTQEEMLGDNFGEDGLPPAYYPTFAKGDDLANDEEDPSNAEWMDVFQKVLEKTEYFIERQLHPELEAQEGGAGSTPSKEAAPPPAPLAVPKKIVPKPQITAASQAPLTVNGNHRWKKPTKSEKRRDLAQKGAFEAFAKALLHSVSPFMEPLRARCRTSLPHLKLDQRFGKSGQPQTAIAQFVVAPLVTNYRPRHFHDVTPGDLMEFHYDLAQVLPQLPSAYALVVGYGPVWHRYAVPYCYISCREYRQEVLSLCPDEVPNSRAEATYDDDIIKDVTEVVLSVEELEPLQKMSMVQAMSKRLNLAPLYDALDAIFKPLENYQVEIWDIYSTPSRFLIKASRLELEQKPQPITLYNDPTLWAELPVVSRSKLLESMSDRVSGAASSPSAVSGTSPAAPPPVHLEGVRSQPMEEAKTSRPALGKTAPRPVASSNLMVVVPMVCTVLSVAATAIILVRKLRATSQ